MALGDTIRWRRHMLGFTQSELAGKVRLHRRRTTHSYICRVESGAIDPPWSFVRSLARALKLRPWMLVADLQDHPDFWACYLALSPTRKREVQRAIEWRP